MATQSSVLSTQHCDAAGIRHRIRLTGAYLARKEAEYDALKAEIDALRRQAVALAPEKEA